MLASPSRFPVGVVALALAQLFALPRVAGASVGDSPLQEPARISTLMPRRSGLNRRAGPPASPSLIGGVTACCVIVLGITLFLLNAWRKRRGARRRGIQQRNVTLAVARSVLRDAQLEAPPPAYRPRAAAAAAAAADGHEHSHADDIPLPVYTSRIPTSNPGAADRRSSEETVVIPKPTHAG
jgi:hypothetical protein